MHNRTLEKMRGGARALGGWIGFADVFAAEATARVGVDWVCFDLQHGALSYSHLLQLIPAIAATTAEPFVRVAANDAAAIGRVLDAGAYGVIVPMVSSADDAARAVAACRYPPVGCRSCGPVRGAMIDGPRYLETANDQVACIAMIETREGLANVDAIACTPGVDGLFIGPMDLCFGIGIAPGDFANPQFIAAVATIRRACEAAGCAAGMFGYSSDTARQALDDGFTFVSVGTQNGFMMAGAKAALDVATRSDSTIRSAAY